MAVVGIDRVTGWRVNALRGLNRATSWSVEEPVLTPLSPCFDDGRCGPFLQVQTDFRIDGESRVTWSLRDNALAAAPYTFQLQVGETANPLADDWQDVGPPLVDAFMAIDPVRRALGKQLVTHYRVKLTDGTSQVYYSMASIVLGKLSFRYWLVLREITRQELLKFRQGPGGVKGFLLKRKRSGAKCPKCLDPFSGEVLNSSCSVCKGTRFIVGYYKAMPCHYTDPGNPKLTEQRVAGNDPAGWSMPTTIQGRFLGSPFLSTGDIWVNATSDLRYHIETVDIENAVLGVPATLMVTLNQLPFNHVAYGLKLD